MNMGHMVMLVCTLLLVFQSGWLLYSAKKEGPTKRTVVLAFVWFGFMVGSLLPIVFVGPIPITNSHFLWLVIAHQIGVGLSGTAMLIAILVADAHKEKG